MPINLRGTARWISILRGAAASSLVELAAGRYASLRNGRAARPRPPVLSAWPSYVAAEFRSKLDLIDIVADQRRMSRRPALTDLSPRLRVPDDRKGLSVAMEQKTGVSTSAPVPIRAARWVSAVVEGYLAPVLLVLLFIGVGSVRLPQPYGLMTGVLMWACCWLFAISGVRRGHGIAKRAAGLTLALLILHAILLALIALHQSLPM
jgi:hypothetical protein